MAHGISENILRGTGVMPAVGAKLTQDGNEFEITQGIIDDIQAYVDFARAVPWVGPMNIESRVNYSVALGVAWDKAWGTADLWGFSQEADLGRVLNIIDLKFGRAPVNPDELPQGILYATGVLQGLWRDGFMPVYSMPVRISIYQPRIAHRPFSWLTTVGHVLARAAEFAAPAQAAVRFAGNAATQQDAISFPENLGEHCHYCRRKLQCKAFQAQLGSMATAAMNDMVSWDAEAWKLRKAVDQFYETMEAVGLAAAERGEVPEGAKLVRGRAGHAKFIVGTDVLREYARSKNLEGEVVETKEVWATPSAVRDSFKKFGVPAADIAKFIQQPEGKPTLTVDTDPRPSIAQTTASKFAQFTTNQ